MWEIVSIFLGLAGLLAWSAINHFYSVSGVWERESSDSGPLSANESDRMSLMQLGPFVIGKQQSNQGRNSFFGFSFGPFLWLKRRDYGIKSLQRQGFPVPIAKRLEGEVLARFRFKLSQDALYLHGYIIPYRIQFTENPARIDHMDKMPPNPRSYKRVQVIPVKDLVPVQPREAKAEST